MNKLPYSIYGTTFIRYIKNNQSLAFFDIKYNSLKNEFDVFVLNGMRKYNFIGKLKDNKIIDKYYDNVFDFENGKIECEDLFEFEFDIKHSMEILSDLKYWIQRCKNDKLIEG